MSAPLLRSLRERLATDRLQRLTRAYYVSSAEELAAVLRGGKAILFLDRTTIPLAAAIAGDPASGPVIAVCDDALPAAVAWLEPYPWISHVLGAAMLDHPIAAEHLENVIRTFTSPKPRLLDWLSPSVTGRRIRLTHASSRVARLEKMTEFLTGHGVTPRSVAVLRDAAEELLTNAFYDAPYAAGLLKQPVPRTQDIYLPEDRACDLAYGCRDDLAIVRVRDPFGSLSRHRLVEVLGRCARSAMQVQVDETSGGAGLGMWRVFSGASFVGVLVAKNRHTEILVGIAKRAASGSTNLGVAKPFAFHLFFQDSEKRRFWQLSDPAAREEAKHSSLDHSVAITAKSK